MLLSVQGRATERTATPPAVVRAASERDFPPLALVGPDGKADGFSVDLFEAVAAAMGLDYEITIGSFGDIKSNLETGRSDVLLNLAYSEERARSADFAVPHTRINGAIFVRRGESRVRSESDLPGASIAVLRGDLAHDWAAAQGWSAQLTATDTTEEAMRLLAAGRVDCVLVAKLVGIVTLHKLGIENVVTTGPPITGFAQKFSFAVRKGDTELLAKLNEGLAIVTADGSFAELHQQWFGPFEPRRIDWRELLRYALPVALVVLFVLGVLNRRLLRATRELRAIRESLELRVSERTRDLAAVNASLETEVEERRRAEAELRHALSLEEATFESTDDGLLVVDRAGRIERFNQSLVRMFSLPAAVLGAHDAEKVLEFVTLQLVEPGSFREKIHRLGAQPDRESFDVLELRDRRVIEAASNPQRIGGIPVGRVWSFRDVTQRRRAEQRFEELAETIDDVFWMGDPVAHRVHYVSPAFERLFGRAPTSLFVDGTALVEMVHPDDRAAVTETLERVRRGEPTSLEFRVQDPDGSVRWLWNRSFPVRDERGELVRTNGITSDITARRRAEAERQLFERGLQQTQRLESLGLLAGGIAHDFNNLLTGVLGNASLARAAAPQEAGLQDSLEQIEVIALRAAELCRQLLAYAGKGTFSETRLDLNAVIRESMPLLRLSVGAGVVLDCDLARTLPCVHADQSQIRQVLMNLVINASEAIGERGGVVVVTTGCARMDPRTSTASREVGGPATDEWVFLEVRDDGCGMDAVTQERIFDPFFTTKFAGRGLGLAAVLGIVRRHSGVLRVESEPGHGSCFRVMLPAIEGAPEMRSCSDGGETQRGRGLVLVVDDEASVRDVVARMLESAGYEVLQAADGDQAVETFRAHCDRLGAVVLDLTMPRVDGRAAFLAMRSLRAGVPILMMTGFSEQEVTERFEGGGPSGFLHKPFRPSELLGKLSEVLRST